jgi:hypothetical protein
MRGSRRKETHMDDVAPSPETSASAQEGAAQEQPVDPSLNAGREAFGEVSDFGIQTEPDALGTDNPSGRELTEERNG